MSQGSDTAAPTTESARLDLHRRCTECGGVLEPPPGKRLRNDAKTCSTKCRRDRSRRLAKERRNAGRAPNDGIGTDALRKLADPRRAADILAEVMRDELRPVVREQITEHTLRAIQGLVALTPVMVEAIGRDLEHPDPVIRQRAYSVMARYTLGHSAIVTPPEEAHRQTMTVIFDGMVRPGQQPTTIEADPAPVDEPQRICNSCDATKPAAEFVEHSDRCVVCHEQLQARMREVVGDA